MGEAVALPVMATTTGEQTGAILTKEEPSVEDEEEEEGEQEEQEEVEEEQHPVEGRKAKAKALMGEEVHPQRWRDLLRAAGGEGTSQQF